MARDERFPVRHPRDSSETLEGKAKLSQNRRESDRRGVTGALRSGDGDGALARQLGEWMHDEL